MMNHLETRNCHRKYDEIIGHISEHIDTDIELSGEESDIIEVENFCKRLRDTNRTCKFDNIYWKGEKEDWTKCNKCHWLASNILDLLRDFWTFARVCHMTSTIIFPGFPEEKSSSSNCYKSYERRHDTIKTYKIPRFEPDIQDEKIHNGFSEEENPCYLNHLLAISEIDKHK